MAGMLADLWQGVRWAARWTYLVFAWLMGVSMMIGMGIAAWSIAGWVFRW